MREPIPQRTILIASDPGKGIGLMQAVTWMGKTLAGVALIAALTPVAICADTTSPGRPAPGQASHRLPHGFKPNTLQARWDPRNPTAGKPRAVEPAARAVAPATSPPAATSALGLPTGSGTPPAANRARVVRTSSVVSEPIEPIEGLPSPLEEEYLGISGDDCASCGGSTRAAAGQEGHMILPGLGLDHLSIFGGVHAMKGSANRGQDGSFGFHEGLNFGTSARNIILPPSVGWQVGFQAMQNNLEGASFTGEQRDQYFLTADAFRRGDYGLQGGLVVDYLWDKWYYDLKVAQLRGEIEHGRLGLQRLRLLVRDGHRERYGRQPIGFRRDHGILGNEGHLCPLLSHQPARRRIGRGPDLRGLHGR